MNLKNTNIQLYDEKFIESLKNLKCNGIPLHILALSYYLCRKNCHFVTIQLTRGMPTFTLVCGNVNIYKEKKEGNHSWIENDGYVYDTTKGLKYIKKEYYDLYKPNIIWTCNQDNCFENPIYKEVYNEGLIEVKYERFHLELTFKLLEYLEKRMPTINGEWLLKEIQDYRDKYPFNQELPKKMVKQYIEDMSKVCLEGIKQ